MSVLKRNSVYFGGGVDISNTIEPHKKPTPAGTPAAEVREPVPAVNPDPEQELQQVLRLPEFV